MLFSYPLSLLFSFLLGLLEYGILRLFEHILSDNMTWQAIAQSHFVVSLSEGTVFFFISLNLIAVLAAAKVESIVHTSALPSQGGRFFGIVSLRPLIQ